MREINDPELLNHYLQTFELEAAFHDRLRPYLTLYSFEQGEKICSQDERAQQLLVLVKGKIKIYTISKEGKTLILSFKNPLEVIGDIEYVRGAPILNTVEAVSLVHMIGIQHRWLDRYGKDHAPLQRLLLEIITEKFYLKSNAMSFNLMYPVEVRLASYLLSVSYAESDDRLNGQLNSTKVADAASLIGTSYRHLNRVIRRFVAEGLIERNKDGLSIKDRDGLRELANDNIYE